MFLQTLGQQGVSCAPRTGSGIIKAPLSKWREQPAIEWAQRVTSNTTCERSKSLNVLVVAQCDLGRSVLLLVATALNFAWVLRPQQQQERL